MKKAIKLLFSVACFSMLSLSACGGNTPQAHKHTWSSGWSSDATNHWHECEECGAKKDKAAHEYDDDHDAICNVCGYERSLGDHVAESSWSHDGAHHWHACAHEGCEIKFDYAEHNFDDDHDTTCECEYVRDIGDHAPKSAWLTDDQYHWHACQHEGCELKFDYNEHSWSDGWSSDATNHWHECEACGAKKDEAAHEYDDDHDTTCECGYVRDIGDHAPKSTWSRNGTHHWHACTHEGCELKFDYEEHQLNVVGGCIDCYYSFETIYTVDHLTQSCDITFNNLEAKTYYFWVSELSVDLTYQIRFPYDQVVNCYYYASASATVLSSVVYDFKYDNPSYISLPSAHYTDFFFNFTVGQDKVGKNYTGISVRSFDI